MTNDSKLWNAKAVLLLSVFATIITLPLSAQTSQPVSQITTQNGTGRKDQRAVRDQYMTKFYWNLNGTGKQEFKATLEQAIQAGDPCARLFKSMLYFTGQDNIYPKDSLRAKALAEDAILGVNSLANDGDAWAQYILGYSHLLGLGISANPEMAVEYFSKAAKNGNAPAQCTLGACYFDGTGVSKNCQEGALWFFKAAEQGLAKAQFRLGFCYATGEGVEQNTQQAITWYRKAAEQGHDYAQYSLGLSYANGNGVAKDTQQAVVWFRKAAEQGFSMAQCSLADCYLKGQGVAKSDVQAVTWLRKAAEQGVIEAQCSLAGCYMNGQGIAKDYKQAVMWFCNAAAQGDAKAQCLLAYCLMNGHGIEKNEKQAFALFEKASNQGFAEGQYALGMCYLNGQGVDANPFSASILLKQAAAQGFAPAIEILENPARESSHDISNHDISNNDTAPNGGVKYLSYSWMIISNPVEYFYVKNHRKNSCGVVLQQVAPFNSTLKPDLNVYWMRSNHAIATQCADKPFLLKPEDEWLRSNWILSIITLGRNRSQQSLDLAYQLGAYGRPYSILFYSSTDDKSTFLPTVLDGPSMLLYGVSWLVNIPQKFVNDLAYVLHESWKKNGDCSYWVLIDVVLTIVAYIIDICLGIVFTIIGVVVGCITCPLSSITSLLGMVWYLIPTLWTAVVELIFGCGRLLIFWH